MSKYKHTYCNYFTHNTNSTYISAVVFRRIATYGISVFLLLATLLFVNPPFHDDSSSATTREPIASDTWLSLSIDYSELALELVPTSTNGTFMSTADTEDHANISVVTNNITGYTLGIKASGSSNSNNNGNSTVGSDIYRDLISTDDRCIDTPTSSKCAISSLSTAVSKEEYSDSSTSGAEFNNTWGYMPSKYNSLDNTDYLPAPTISGDVLDSTSAPNSPKPGQPEGNTYIGDLQPNEYTIDLGSRVDYTTYTGSYSNTFIVTAVGNPVPYSVTYNANKPEQAPATANVDNIPRPQTGTVSSGNTIAVVLDTKVPTIGNENPNTGEYTYAGYVFNGWCNAPTETPAEINGQTNTQGYQICPEGATVYQPGDIYGIDQLHDINTETLYAIWGAPAKVTFHGNGLVFMNASTGTTDTENIVNYVPLHEGNTIDTSKQNYTADNTSYKTPVYDPDDPDTNIIFKGWSEDPNATEATYIDQDAIRYNLDLNAEDKVELYAVWAYATKITFNRNGADGTENMEDQLIEAGTTEALYENTYTKEGYYFAGWNAIQIPVDQDLEIMYRNRANFTAANGSNNVVLYVVWTDCPPNNICYNDNGASSPITMGNQTENYGDNTNPIASNMDTTLWPMNYKYDTNNDGYNDYGFAGWSEDKNAASKIIDNDPDDDPVIYGPNQTITLGDISTCGMKLYAVWIPVAKDNIGTELTFQTENLLTTTLTDGTTLNSKPVKYVTALRDYRDNQVYAVAKLADNNYWMIENLRLDNNPDQSNWGDNNLSQGFGGDFIGLAAAEDEHFVQYDVTPNSLYDTGDYYTMPRYNNVNTASPISNMTAFDSDTNVYSLGNYYTWAAAIASTIPYGDRDYSVNVDTSICPAGWHLPYGKTIGSPNAYGVNLGGTSGGFAYLDIQMGGIGKQQQGIETSNRWRTFPNNFVYSGVFNVSLGVWKAHRRSEWGNYHSSTAYAGQACDLSIWNNPLLADPGGMLEYKTDGQSIRCVQSAQ